MRYIYIYIHMWGGWLRANWWFGWFSNKVHQNTWLRYTMFRRPMDVRGHASRTICCCIESGMRPNSHTARHSGDTITHGSQSLQSGMTTRRSHIQVARNCFFSFLVFYICLATSSYDFLGLYMGKTKKSILSAGGLSYPTSPYCTLLCHILP
jgi:hypothetical protein